MDKAVALQSRDLADYEVSGVGVHTLEEYFAAISLLIERLYLHGGASLLHQYIQLWLNDAREARTSYRRCTATMLGSREASLSSWKRLITRAHMTLKFLHQIRKAEARG